MRQFTFFIIFSSLASLVLAQQNAKPLYTAGKAPFALKTKPSAEVLDTLKGHYSVVSVPTIAVYKPEESPKRKAVLVLPGGGYGFVSYEKEGHRVAEVLAKYGYPAFVLKYRLPDKKAIDSTQRHWVPLADVSAAIRWIKKNASEFGVDTAQIGLLGFSAGGHLAASASTLYNKHPHGGNDVKPAFSALIYPVISAGPSKHASSFRNLLGQKQDEAMLQLFSLENQVNAQTPPTYLVHAQDDKSVPAENSILYFQALTRMGVPAELHISALGGHGFGMGPSINKNAPDWFPGLITWLEE